jgi:hypothetical protein
LYLISANVGRKEGRDDQPFTVREKLDADFDENAGKVRANLGIEALPARLGHVVHDTIGLFQHLGSRRFMMTKVRIYWQDVIEPCVLVEDDIAPPAILDEL